MFRNIMCIFDFWQIKSKQILNLQLPYAKLICNIRKIPLYLQANEG